MRLFCWLGVGIFVVISGIYLILAPQEFRLTELFVWAFLLFTSLLVLFINKKVKSLMQAKLNALLFAVAFVAALASIFLIYPEYAIGSFAIFSLSMFVISFVIPWDLVEVMYIWIFHVIGYTFLYLWSKPITLEYVTAVFARKEYADGVIFLTATFVICIMIKKRDNAREKERFILLKELEVKNNQMEQELVLARDIHKTLIPHSTSTENTDIAVSYVPLSAVGGDYATFHVNKDGNLFFLIGDITGHGVSAALLVNRIYGEVEALIKQYFTPGALLRELDNFVQEHFQETRMYISACCGLLDFKKKILFYSNYGHPPQILHQKQANNIFLLESQTYFLGIGVDNADLRTKMFEGTLNFEDKDRIILFTDGLIETIGKDGEFFGMEKLKAFVKNYANEHPAVFNSNLLKELDKFRNGPVSDDLFLLTIDIK